MGLTMPWEEHTEEANERKCIGTRNRGWRTVYDDESRSFVGHSFCKVLVAKMRAIQSVSDAAEKAMRGLWI